jgi:hypothetical protein
MSMTPSTNSPCYLSLNPTLQYVTLGTANLPTTLTASAVQNRAGLGDAVIQNTASAQPGWSSNAVVGAYIATDKPGAGSYPTTSAAGTSALSGVPGFTFNGSTQYFEYDTLASKFTGTEVGITVVCVVTCSALTAGPFAVWSFGAAGTNNTLTLQYVSGAVQLVNNDSGTSYTASVSGVNSGLAVVSATRIANSLSLRVWTNNAGTPTLNTSAAAPISVPAAATYSTFCVGALNSNGSVSNKFTGTIGRLAVFGVQAGTTVADVEETEAEWLLSAGISRVMDIAQTATAQEE